MPRDPGLGGGPGDSSVLVPILVVFLALMIVMAFLAVRGI
jgi:hypothetical protein